MNLTDIKVRDSPSFWGDVDLIHKKISIFEFFHLISIRETEVFPTLDEIKVVAPTRDKFCEIMKRFNFDSIWFKLFHIFWWFQSSIKEFLLFLYGMKTFIGITSMTLELLYVKLFLLLFHQCWVFFLNVMLNYHWR
jgi:hypothetical protein